jgi:hypothetical protein
VNDSSNANACVRDVVTSLEYWIAAIAATDIGKVYAHHRTENLQKKKSQQYTSTLFKPNPKPLHTHQLCEKPPNSVCYTSKPKLSAACSRTEPERETHTHGALFQASLMKGGIAV